VTALTTPMIWYFSRASGIVTLLLFTVVMAFGIMTATRVGGAPVPRFAVAELHRRLSLLGVVFLAIHVFTTVIDTYVNVGIVAAFVPFTSHYKTLWVAMGALALDLMIAVIITSLLRNRMSHATWRAIHWISYLAWPIALIHSIFIGTDIRFGWMDLIVAACVALVGAALIWRIWAHPRPGGSLTAGPGRSPLNRRAAGAPPASARPAPSATSSVRQVGGSSTPRARQSAPGRPVASSSKTKRPR